MGVARHRWAQHGFTLLEMLAVVAILAILSGTLLSRLGDRGLAKLRLAERTATQVDALARQMTEQQSKPVSLRIDVTAGTLTIEEDRRDDGEFMPRRLPAGVTLERAVSSREDRTRGELVVPFQPGGQSVPYAIKLRSTGEQACWLVYAGGTGQVARYGVGSQPDSKDEFSSHTDDRSIQDFFRTLSKRARPDAS